MLGRDDTVCVGAAYGTSACGAALAQRDQRGRLLTCAISLWTPKPGCAGWGPICSAGCWGSSGPGAAGRSGRFTPPACWRTDNRRWASWSGRAFPGRRPVSTGFSTRLGDIPDVSVPPVARRWRYILRPGRPAGAGAGRLSWFCWAAGALARFCQRGRIWPVPGESSPASVRKTAPCPAWFLIDRKGEGCHLAGTVRAAGVSGRPDGGGPPRPEHPDCQGNPAAGDGSVGFRH